ncbi:MAG: DoxX family protein [Pseudomonadota bacterium]
MMQDTKPQKRPLAQWFFIAATIVLTAVLLAAGGQKLLGTEQMVALFDDIGLGQWLRFAAGFWGIVAAILLNIDKWRLIGGAMAVCICIGAVIAQLAFGQSILPAIILLAVSVLVVSADRRRHVLCTA